MHKTPLDWKYEEMIHVLAVGYGVSPVEAGKLTEFDYYKYIGFENMKSEREDHIMKSRNTQSGNAD